MTDPPPRRSPRRPRTGALAHARGPGHRRRPRHRRRSSPSSRPRRRCATNQVIEVAGADHYVSRGAHKLIAALDAFPRRPVAGRVALDAGASTGGFSQVLLERGARTVIARRRRTRPALARLLAGRAALAVVEGFNVRDMTAEIAGRRHPASRIARPRRRPTSRSSRSPTVLPALVATAVRRRRLRAADQAAVRGRAQSGIREGIVHDAGTARRRGGQRALGRLDLGLGTAGLIPRRSPAAPATMSISSG